MNFSNNRAIRPHRSGQASSHSISNPLLKRTKLFAFADNADALDGDKSVQPAPKHTASLSEGLPSGSDLCCVLSLSGSEATIGRSSMSSVTGAAQ